MEITLLQAVLIGVFFAIAGVMTTNVFGWLVLISKPLVCGAVVGIILGRPVEGMVIGAAINMLYLGWVSAGGAISADPCMAGVFGTTLAIAGGLDTASAVALAVPFGLVGGMWWITHMVINSPITHLTEKYALKGNYKGMLACNVVLPETLRIIDRLLISIPALYFGTNAIAGIFEQMPPWVMSGLSTIGGILPAIGICMALNSMLNLETAVYFMLGFLMFQYMNLPLMVIAIIGVIMAFIIVVQLGTKDEEEMDVSVDEAETIGKEKDYKPLSKKAKFKSFLTWRAWSHTCYNYERMQGMSFAQAMYPILRELYPTKEQIGKELAKHCVYFNTEPNCGSIIPGIAAAMEEERANRGGIKADDITSIKSGLMGPFAAVGDTLEAGIITPLFLSIGISMANQGNLMGPWFSLLAGGAVYVIIGYYMWNYGYKFGKSAVEKLLGSNMLRKIMQAAGILGCTVMGAMVASTVQIYTPVVLSLGEDSMNDVTKALTLQSSLFDALLKGLLPLVCTFGIFWLMKKKGWSTNKLLLVFGIGGFILGALGILSNVAPM